MANLLVNCCFRDAKLAAVRASRCKTCRSRSNHRYTEVGAAPGNRSGNSGRNVAVMRYPSNSWGAFARDPSLDVGIVGEDLAEVVRQTWFDAGGTEVTFEETFPQFAEYAKKHSVLT